MNAETVLKILETRHVLYRRPLKAEFYVLLTPSCLELVLLEKGNEERSVGKVTLWREFPNGRMTAARPSTDLTLGEGAFANFLATWSTLYRERRWKAIAPSFGEIVRVVNAYAGAIGYRLFTFAPEESPTEAEPYAPVEIETMHEMTDWNS